MRLIWSNFALHFTIGAGFAVIAVVTALRAGRERRLFHFGGSDTFSWGERRFWVGWFILSYFFEVGSSFLLGAMLYDELALSLIEACGMTTGFFLVDRVAMLFEPMRKRPLVVQVEEIISVETEKEARMSVPVEPSPARRFADRLIASAKRLRGSKTAKESSQIKEDFEKLIGHH